jgi:phytoene dehydrogenase-like protein
MLTTRLKRAIIVGAGPNGLAAAIELARAGYSVTVREAADVIGGGTRTEEVTLPGFLHDICSAIHPLAIASPFFRSLPLKDFGLELIQPPISLAHPFDDGTAVTMHRSIEETGESFRNAHDATAYRNLMKPLVDDWEKLMPDLLAPLGFPNHPIPFARFGLRAMRSAEGVAKSHFKGERARGFFCGLAAHSMVSLDEIFTASFGLVLGITGHAVGWVIPRGGSKEIANALAAYLKTLGGEIIVGAPVESIDELISNSDDVVICDLVPRGLLKIAGHRLPENFRRKLENYRNGAAAFKIDWALDGPIPWKAEECALAGTVHLGCTLEELVASESAPGRGENPAKPYVLIAQQSHFDSTRAPAGKHTGWAYCHVPNGSTFDMTERIEDQIERFAPGFRKRILARAVMTPYDLERHNANMVGGNISGGATDLRQLFLRPTRHLYSTPLKNLYICSSATPPGGGVHGMCGYYAAKTVLKNRQ